MRHTRTSVLCRQARRVTFWKFLVRGWEVPRLTATARGPKLKARFNSRPGERVAIDKTIAAVFITIATVIAIVGVINGFMPSLDVSNAALSDRRDSLGDSVSSATEIVQVTTVNALQVDVWVKNIGSSAIREPAQVTTLFGPEGNEVSYRYGAPGCTAPCWEFAPNSADPWEAATTVGLRIHIASPLVVGQKYVVRAVTLGQHQSYAEFYYEPSLATATITPTPTATPTASPTPTPTPCPTGSTALANPSSQSFDTGGSGDGWEIAPVNAFANDTAFAINFNGAGDQHRYFDYNLSLPASCTLTGISLRLDWWLDSTDDTNSISAELSWDGGASWTTAATDTAETTTEHTTTLGGASDTWGRAWTESEFSNANFRVRLTANSDGVSRDFFLDWAAVSLHYGP